MKQISRRAALRRAIRKEGPAALLLAGFVLLLYGQLLFTNRVLAGGDIQLYFYPYWEYVGATLRAGQFPFWNPYLFLGAPLLANPQTAVLYPLHWPLFAAGGLGLPVTQQLYWSAALHTWLLGLGGYALLRQWRYGAAPALLTGIVLAGSGFAGGLLGHVNQLNVVSWLPWAALCLAVLRVQVDTPAPLRLKWGALLLALAAFAVLVALMLLAGHTQSVFINLFGLGLWIVWPGGGEGAATRGQGVSERTTTPQNSRFRALASRLVHYSVSLAPLLLVYWGGVALALLLAAPQLLPTLELSELGLRSGGLSYAEASSFSLKPLAIGWTLLPSYGLAPLSTVFDTPAFTEYVAYVGFIGLGLAVVGAWKGRGPARTFGLLFVVLGLLLALGRWNPLYFLLYQVVPGFDLFRAPARWMMLYTLGSAVLAGVGLAALGASRPRWARTLPVALLIGLAALELLAAARALPHTHPTAPQAVYDLRTAPAHLLTDPARAVLGPAAAPRFLGMSTITYDPGDMVDYRRILLETAPAQLTAGAFADLVIAQKVQELLAPNLPLFWRVPAVDGFDGGVLPLQRYIRFAELLVPADRLVPDGRLREQIAAMPDSRLLAMLNVGYVITDKVRDLWFEDVFYDRQIGADLRRTTAPLVIEAPLPFEATHIDLIGYVDGEDRAVAALAGAARPVAWLEVIDREGRREPIALTAGGTPGAHFADDALGSPLAAASGAVVAYRDAEGGRQEYRARLPLRAPATIAELRITAAPDEVALVVQAATLYDARTGMFSALLPSDRGRFQLEHSGDVKVYRNLDNAPRVYLADALLAAPSLDAALDALRTQVGRVTVVEGALDGAQPARAGDHAELIAYAAERVEVATKSAAPALLVLSDSLYPGWTATVDGAPVAIKPVNGLFRGVVVPAGEHRVVFEFAPVGWQRGLWLAAAGATALLLASMLGVWRATRRERARSPS